MSRDANGNYTLPAGNPVVTGTVITSTWANSTLPDLGTEMTDSLSRSGKGGMLAPLKLVDEDLPTPGLTFANELTSGLRRAGAGDIRLIVQGTDVILASGAQQRALAWDPDTSQHVPIITTSQLIAENEMINGYFDVWQRWTAPQTVSGYGADDRWSNDRLISTQTMQRAEFAVDQVDVPGGPRYYSRNAVASVASAAAYVKKTYKAPNIRKYAGQKMHFAFYGKAELSKPVAIEFFMFFGTGGSPSPEINGIGVTQPVLLTTWSEHIATVDLPTLNGITLGTLRDDYLGINIWYDAGSNYNSRTGNLGQQGGTFDIAACRLGFGADVPMYRRRTFEEEMTLCEAFYARSYNIEAPNSNAPDYNGVETGEASHQGNIWSRVTFKNRLRYPPSTITLYAAETGTPGNITVSLPGTPTNAPATPIYAGETGFNTQNNTTVTIGTRYAYHWSAEAEILT